MNNLESDYFKQIEPRTWYPILVFECINVPYNAPNFTVGQEYYCLRAPKVVSDDTVLQYRIDIMDDNGEIHELCPSNFRQLKKVYTYNNSFGSKPNCFEIGTLVSQAVGAGTTGEPPVVKKVIEDIDSTGMIRLGGFDYYKSAWLLTQAWTLERNARRIELIDKEVTNQISSEEAQELESLTLQMRYAIQDERALKASQMLNRLNNES